jgi:hypothetical protein
MLRLIRKDIRVIAAFGWLIAWLVAPSYLVPAMVAARAGGAMLWVHVAFGAAAIVSACLLEARSGADRFVHSLPVTRADVVRGRYGTAVVAALIVMGVGAAFGLVVGAASPDGAWPRWLAPDAGLAYLVVMAIITAVYLPCYFRWGYGAGSVVAAMLLAGLVLAGDAAGSAARMDTAGGQAQPGLPRGLVMRLTAAAVGQWGLVAASFAAFAVAAMLLAASAAIAARAYRNRQF